MQNGPAIEFMMFPLLPGSPEMVHGLTLAIPRGEKLLTGPQRVRKTSLKLIVNLLTPTGENSVENRPTTE
jgi:hypothetical protein